MEDTTEDIILIQEDDVEFENFMRGQCIYKYRSAGSVTASTSIGEIFKLHIRYIDTDTLYRYRCTVQ